MAFINHALLIGVQSREQTQEEAQNLLDELVELVSNLNVGIVAQKLVKIRDHNPKFLVGKGKMAELLELAIELNADSIIFDEALTPAQQRNWEQMADNRLLVIDRQEVILDIFNRRAQTREARLQVELARLEYDLPRMKRAWTHLDRQRGGGAVQRDAGEKQIEIDQRLIRQRISRVKKELQEVVQHREVQRKKRVQVPLPTAAMIGYTNAGKSSLLNFLTQSSILVEDKLFATLDPTTRRMELPNGQPLLLTDTVGFVRRLPHKLVEAFKATLEEAIIANFLIHVIDASSPAFEEHRATTLAVIRELGADQQPMITVFNKMDRLSARHPPLLTPLNLERSVCISVKTGEGVDTLLEHCQELLQTDFKTMQLVIPHNRYDLINHLHEAGSVDEERHEENGVHITGRIPNRLLDKLKPFSVG